MRLTLTRRGCLGADIRAFWAVAVALPPRSSWQQGGQHAAAYRRDRPRPVPVSCHGQPEPSCTLFDHRARAGCDLRSRAGAVSGQISARFGPLPWPCRHARHGSKGASTPQPTGMTGQGPSPYHATASPSPRALFLSPVRVHGCDLRPRALPVWGQISALFGPLPWPCRHARHGSKGASTPQPTGATGQGPSTHHATASPSPRALFLSTVHVHG